MASRLRRSLTFSNVCSFLALTIALGTGGAYAANTIGSADIINDSILSEDIKNANVTLNDVAANAVNSAKVADNSLASADILNFALTASDLALNSVTDAKITAGAVSTAKLGDAAVTEAKIGLGAVTTTRLAGSAVTEPKLAPNSVVSSKVLDDTEVGGGLNSEDINRLNGAADIQSNTITTFEIADNAIDSDEVLDFGLTNQDVGVLFAQINADHTVANSSGGVTSIDLGTGFVEVDFGRDISNCAFTSTQGEANPGGAGGAITGVTDRAGNVEGVFATTRNADGTSINTAFQLVVVC